MPQQTALLSARERAYLSTHSLGRLATVGRDGGPHVVPVGFVFNSDGFIEIGGPNMGSSLKYRNIQRDSRVAFVVDDTTAPDDREFKPGVGRGIEIRGRAEALTDHEPPALAPPGFYSREVIRIQPEQVISWHIDPGRRGLRVLRERGGRL